MDYAEALRRPTPLLLLLCIQYESFLILGASSSSSLHNTKGVNMVRTGLLTVQMKPCHLTVSSILQNAYWRPHARSHPALYEPASYPHILSG